MPQIECTGVSLAYERGVVLRDLNFSVERGDYLCVVGENGSGKSTLAKALLGLKAPLAGRIVFDESLRRRGIGYLPQQSADRSDFPASVWEVTLSGRAARLGLRPFYNRADKEAAMQSLRRLGIEELQKQPCASLSGGQRQRVLLARALCAGDGLLLLDEPVAGLDPTAAAEMYAVIRELHQSGTTVIMISHDLAGALRDATTVLHLHHEPLFFGPKTEYLKSGLCRGLSGEGAAYD